jgi:ubiquinone/menaquinone biosynthesis C-methylase UbiE
MGSIGKNIGFNIMTAFFRLRDFITPPGEVLDTIGLGPGMRMLDFGCGPGSFSLKAAEMVGPGGRVYAADRLSLAVARVRRKAARKGLENLKAIGTDGPTGLASGSIDRALLFDIFHSLDHPDLVLAEIDRVLKPQGTLWVSDHHLEAEEVRSGLEAAGPVIFRERRDDLFCFAKAGLGAAPRMAA